MITSALPQKWPPKVLDAIKLFRQGHLIEAPPAAYAANPAYAILSCTEGALTTLDSAWPYAMILTQTCDICEEGARQLKKPFIDLAPVYDFAAHALPGQDAQIRRNGIKHLVSVSALTEPGLWVADLRLNYPAEKSVLVDKRPMEAFGAESEYGALAERLADRAIRPALDAKAQSLVVDEFEAAVLAGLIPGAGIVEVRANVSPTWDNVRAIELIVLHVNAPSVSALVEATSEWQLSRAAAIGAELTLLPVRVEPLSEFSYIDGRATYLLSDQR